ncbi:MAG: COX15/CtaA family protein [Gammaproteobacteria bacterium]|nr:COX15/CtaA family protein [Gammaproteobacteria bacterium]MCP5200539.1 COX15/CtaA family protein [Gammaproteobacteria bacterium]
MARLYRVLALLLPLLALTVIVFGAYVRLSDAGLGCPDWPGCYGRLTVPEGQADVHLEHPDWSTRPLEAGKAWREMIHRYLASTLGLGIVVLAALAWRRRHERRASPVVYLLVPLVVFQGLLGMWTVTLLLKPLVVTAHLLGGLTTLALLWWHYLGQASPGPVAAAPRPLHVAAGAALAVLALQIFLGGWTSANYAALACTDFPTCHGRWWPETDFGEAFVLWRGLGVNYEFGVLDTPARTAIHVAHRLGAALTALTVLAVALGALGSGLPRLRRVGWCILAALLAQLVLGITNVLGGLPLAVAVAHNGGAAVLMLSLVTLLHLTRRI